MKKEPTDRKVVINETVIEELSDLFEFTSPTSMRKSLHHVFYSFLLYSCDTLPGDFERITTDFYFLINFLQRIEND